ncbi:hypothetical protein EDD15DRAFT_2372436 [Pisolithus albus]|nr:hypothetical protein EDD15DRAFT_2372436 [Pisolithus albus]
MDFLEVWLPEDMLTMVPLVQWDATHTKQLITWLLTHAADCHILFHDKNTRESSHAPPAAPGDKPSGHNKVCLAIASHIFANDPVYSGQWAINSNRFQVSVMNCLVSLKGKYHEHAKSLSQTGAGVAPRTDNLCEMIINSFPHFKDLDSIWRGNPSFNARPFTSDQQMNCAEDMLSLVWGGATCAGDDMFTARSGEPTTLQVNLPAGDHGDDGTVPWGDYGGMGEDDRQEGEHMGEYDSQVDIGGTSYGRDYDVQGGVGGTFDDDTETYEGFGDDLGCPTGVRTWWEAVPPGMQVDSTPQMKCHTMSWDSQDAFKFTEPSYHYSTPASTSSSVLTSVTSHSCHCFLLLWNALEPRAEVGSNKYKYAIHSKELVYRWEEAIHQWHEAELIHKCLQESKQLEIQLMTAQVELFEKQAAALCLQIQLAEIEAKKCTGSVSGNAGVSASEGAL